MTFIACLTEFVLPVDRPMCAVRVVADFPIMALHEIRSANLTA
jgi:hypothetical protein